MILLSRIFKHYQSPHAVQEKKTISIRPIKKKSLSQYEEENEQLSEQAQSVILDAKAKAEQIISMANDEASNIKEAIKSEKAAWNEEKQLLMQEAEKKGFEVGRQEGIAQGYSEMEEAIAQAKSVIETAKEHYDEKLISAEGVILQLGMKTAEKIIGLNLTDDDEKFTSVVKAVLKEVRENEDIQIHVHPYYYDLIAGQYDELLNIFPKETSLYIYPNDELAETDCFIETENGRIDASIDSQLSEIKRKLFELLESGM